jgi:nitroimidazol reductase NimA-like FMN-containing flavoprotein (pyridoxamine 5'-phosphate oxidase superfamily)
MPYTFRELTNDEREEFLTDNVWGILSFSGDTAYAIPLGYRYRKGHIIFGLEAKGRKMEYISNNRSVCLVVCRPASLSLIRKESHPFKTVIIEGDLEDMSEKDLSYYGLPPRLPDNYNVALFKIKPKSVGTQEMGIAEPDVWE